MTHAASETRRTFTALLAAIPAAATVVALTVAMFGLVV